MSLNPLSRGSLAWGLLVLLIVVAPGGSGAAWGQFVRGADISSVPVLENAGAKWSHDGKAGDPIQIFEKNGVNSFRLRIFVDPTGVDPFVVQDLDYTVALAKRAKANGASLLLDFHYSDTWADPGKQFKPVAWEGLGYEQIKQQVYNHTKQVMETLDAAGVRPEKVQIGNEISNGMIWDEGRLWQNNVPENVQFDQLAGLLSSGISGARDGSGSDPVEVMLHHDKGADWDQTSRFFNKLLPRLESNGSVVDSIGYSYYPRWHYDSETKEGGLEDLQANLNNTVDRWNLPVYLVETAFPWRNSGLDRDYEFDLSPEGQRAFLEAVTQAVEKVPGGMGKGVYWWYPEAVQAEGLEIWEGGRYSLFNQNGETLPALSVFSASEASVPEPSSGALLLPMALFTCCFRTRKAVNSSIECKAERTGNQ